MQDVEALKTGYALALGLPELLEIRRRQLLSDSSGRVSLCSS